MAARRGLANPRHIYQNKFDKAVAQNSQLSSR